jgi:hypothetical protein
MRRAGPETPPTDPALAAPIDAWPKLPEAIQGRHPVVGGVYAINAYEISGAPVRPARDACIATTHRMVPNCCRDFPAYTG